MIVFFFLFFRNLPGEKFIPLFKLLLISSLTSWLHPALTLVMTRAMAL